MADAQVPIALTTRTFDSQSGVSRVAKDVLLGLSRCSSELQVCAWVPTRLPTSVDGHAIGPYRVEALPLGLVARAVRAGDAPPRSLVEHARLAWSGSRVELAPAAPIALELVNGLGAHGLHQRLAAVRARAARTALMVHESPRHFEERGRDALREAIAAVRSYDWQVFVSDRGRSEWSTLAELDASRTFYIPNCVNEQQVASVTARDRAALRGAFACAADSVCFACVGTVSPRKGQDVVLQALQRLDLGHVPWRVDFLGACSSAWAKHLAAKVAGTQLAKHVRFLGAVDDVYERMFAADAVLLASRAEAFPLSVLEALALGTCVIASSVDGIPEQIEHARTGLLFAQADASALAEQLQRVATQPELRRSLGAAGREHYRARFTRELQLARWADAIRHMLT